MRPRTKSQKGDLPPFAQWLRNYLEDTGFSRTDVAFFVRRDQNTINAWCAPGRQKPPEREQPRLVRLLEDNRQMYMDIIGLVDTLYATGRLTEGLAGRLHISGHVLRQKPQ